MKKRKIKKILNAFHKVITKLTLSSILGPFLSIVISLSIVILILPYFIFSLHSVNNDTSKNIKQTSIKTIDNPVSAKVYITESDKTISVDFEEYIKGVVACEMPSTFHKEALKAQAVAARTYSTSRILAGNPSSHPDAPLCNSTHCQVYKSPSQLKKVKGSEWMKKDWEKICKAVDETKNQKLYYNGKLVKQALFHSSSGGRTENSEDVFASAVPYLVSVESPYENQATHQNESHSFSISEFSNKIKEKYPEKTFGVIDSSSIKILSRSNGNRVEKIQIGNCILEGRQVREALGLPSANFNISFNDNYITFTSNGSGHGVGMSQYGADGMAKEGYNYRQILNHYYSGTEIH